MNAQKLETDYLVIGGGAVGMAFVDILLTETNANILIVDKHHKPGGHWNDAYPFVKVHVPSSVYGVSSSELGTLRIDESGFNKDLYELASGTEVLTYYDKVMKHRFLPSGRVQYFPMCEYSSGGCFSSILDDKEYHVNVRKKIVDCTDFKTSVPSTHAPNFYIDYDVNFITINDLPKCSKSYDNYVVVGAGKTGVDACLWLMENHVDPEKIVWVVPRDAWWINRKKIQPTLNFFDDSVGSVHAQLSAIGSARSMEDLFCKLEKSKVLIRLDPNVKPLMFRGASISELEIEELRKIKNIIRKGRIKKISNGHIDLSEGDFTVSENSLFINCSTNGLQSSGDDCPVFDDKKITVKTVRHYQVVFSAAFIAHIEASYDDDDYKNDLCMYIPLPYNDTDWLTGMADEIRNHFIWSQEPGLREWLENDRLDPLSKHQIDENLSIEQKSKLEDLKKIVPSAIANLPNLIKEIRENSEDVEKKSKRKEKNVFA